MRRCQRAILPLLWVGATKLLRNLWNSSRSLVPVTVTLSVSVWAVAPVAACRQPAISRIATVKALFPAMLQYLSAAIIGQTGETRKRWRETGGSVLIWRQRAAHPIGDLGALGADDRGRRDLVEPAQEPRIALCHRAGLLRTIGREQIQDAGQGAADFRLVDLGQRQH